MFFLIKDWERERVDPGLLAREMEVALDIEVVSWFMMVVVREEQEQEGQRTGSCITRDFGSGIRLTSPRAPNTSAPNTASFDHPADVRRAGPRVSFATLQVLLRLRFRLIPSLSRLIPSVPGSELQQ